jgi:hypothetical protein
MTFEPQTPDVIMQENWDFGHGPTADWNGTTDRNVVFMREMKEEGNNEAVAEMTSPVYRGADAKCLLTFWYYVGGNPDGRSVVPNLFTANDGLEYKMDHLPESGGELNQWQWRLIGIGRRAYQFSVICRFFAGYLSCPRQHNNFTADYFPL